MFGVGTRPEGSAHARPYARHRRPLMIALSALIAGCSATPSRLHVPPQDGVRTTYERGAPLLHSERTNRVVLEFTDREGAELLLGLVVENGQEDAFEVSADDVRLALVAADGALTPGTVYSFDELPEDVDTSLAWDSAQAAAGVAAMPIGGIWGSLVRTVMQLGVRAGREGVSEEGGMDTQPASIEDVYFRRHTLDPGEEYRGVLVAELPRAPKPGESLWVGVTSGDEDHDLRVEFLAP